MSDISQVLPSISTFSKIVIPKSILGRRHQKHIRDDPPNKKSTSSFGGLIPVIFTDPGIRRIIATTYPGLRASIRVLEKNGFVPAEAVGSGSGMEEGTVAYTLVR